MIAILHCDRNRAVLRKVKNLSVGCNGFSCELDCSPEDLYETVIELSKNGFEPQLVGKILTMPLDSFTVTEDVE